MLSMIGSVSKYKYTGYVINSSSSAIYSTMFSTILVGVKEEFSNTMKEFCDKNCTTFRGQFMDLEVHLGVNSWTFRYT